MALFNYSLNLGGIMILGSAETLGRNNTGFEIIDSRGRLVANGNGNDTITINTSNYESGIYLVKIKSDQLSSTVRIVKN